MKKVVDVHKIKEVKKITNIAYFIYTHMFVAHNVADR